MLQIGQDIRRSVRAIQAMGLPGYLGFRSAGRSAPDLPIPARVHDTDLQLRPQGTDLRVAVTSLGGEFADLPWQLSTIMPEVIVDAGGYIGTAALALARLFPHALIVTLEPSSANFAVLSANVAGHPRIRPVRAALALRGAGSCALVDRGSGSWGYSIASAGPALEHVPTLCLEEIAAEVAPRRIGLLKLDIEGAEKALFDAPCPTLRACPAILAELHDRIQPGCAAAFARFAADRHLLRCGPEKHLALRDCKTALTA